MCRSVHRLQEPSPAWVGTGSRTFTFYLSVLSYHNALAAGRNPSQHTKNLTFPTIGISICREMLVSRCHSDSDSTMSVVSPLYVIYLLWQYSVSILYSISNLYGVSTFYIISTLYSVSSLYSISILTIISPRCILALLCVLSPLRR